ncbi:hypothetical protein HUU05_00455 [candidate division KSB1 bacterium]|nr:hypothetical protein [candidate division KSB1 bacterium]
MNTAEIEKEYALAQFALKSHDWVQALVALEMIAAANPNYRDANEMLIAARQGMEQDSTEAKLARYYVQGLKAMRAEDWVLAWESFQDVKALHPGFRDTDTLLAKVERELQTLRNAMISDIVIEVPVDSLFPAATAALRREDWQTAVTLLAKLEALYPLDHELRKQAEQARANLLISQLGLSHVDAKDHNERIFEIVLFAGSALALPLLLGLALSSRLRARYYLLRGKPRRAAQIYESVLQRAPERIKLYPTLAHLYLRTGRTDAAAMKVFRTVLQYNLNTPHREQINALIAQTVKPSRENNREAVLALAAVVESKRIRKEQRPLEV